MMLNFFTMAANLKNVSRQGWIDKLSISDPESVADHSYSMAVICMVISDLERYDSEKIIKMTLLHDLAESKTGDIVPGQIPKDRKIALEHEAFVEISKNLPGDIKSQYLKIWNEYQENESPESQMVHQIDKLEMALQAKQYLKDGYSKDKMLSFFETARKEITHPKLKELLDDVMSAK